MIAISDENAAILQIADTSQNVRFLSARCWRGSPHQPSRILPRRYVVNSAPSERQSSHI